MSSKPPEGVGLLPRPVAEVVLKAKAWETTPWYIRFFCRKTRYRRWLVIVANDQINGMWIYSEKESKL